MNVILLGIGIILLVILFFVMLSGIRFIPNNRIGMIEKRWSGKGSVKGGLIALKARRATSRRSCAAACTT